MGPYTVRYAVKLSDDYHADVNSDLNSGRWIATSSCAENSYTLKHVVPGYSYWISVLDSNGEGKYRAYTAPAAQNLSEFSPTMSIEPRTKVGDEVQALNAFVASDIAKDDDILYGGYVQIKYSGLTQERVGQVVLALTAPNGAVIVDTVADLTFSAEGSYTRWWEFFSLEWYFSQVERLYDQILTGEYTLAAYLDGEFACSTTFQVYGEAPDTSLITGTVRNADGSVTVSWKDTGAAPYKLRYTQKVSDSYEDDLQSDKNTGRWIDGDDIQETSFDMKYLIPGETYWLHLNDAAGAEELLVYTHEDLGDFDIPTSISRTYRTRTGDAFTDVDGFYLNEMDLEGETEYGMYVQVNYPAQTEDVPVQCLAVLYDPDGVSLSVSVANTTLKDGSDPYFYWNFFSLNWGLGKLAERFDGLKPGTYTFKLYLNGRYACSTTFDLLTEAPMPGLAVADVLREENGAITITWDDPMANGPYEVDYLLAKSSDFQADYDATELVWIEEEGITGSTCTLDYLVPGFDYWLCVEDAQGNIAYERYQLPVSEFWDSAVSMSVQPKVRIGEAEENRAAFSAAEILAGGKEMGAYLRVTYENQKYTQTYTALFSITSPNGEVVTDYVTDLRLESSASKSTYWSFYGFDWYFDVMNRNFGAIDPGVYIINLYLDGQHAASATFTVTE